MCWQKDDDKQSIFFFIAFSFCCSHRVSNRFDFVIVWSFVDKRNVIRFDEFVMIRNDNLKVQRLWSSDKNDSVEVCLFEWNDNHSSMVWFRCETKFEMENFHFFDLIFYFSLLFSCFSQPFISLSIIYWKIICNYFVSDEKFSTWIVHLFCMLFSHSFVFVAQKSCEHRDILFWDCCHICWSNECAFRVSDFLSSIRPSQRQLRTAMNILLFFLRKTKKRKEKT